jgi:hypothetical protein
VPAARDADADDQREQHEEVRQANHGEVGAELGVLPGRDVEGDHAGDEEDQQQRPDQLSDVRRETSILHFEPTSSFGVEPPTG